MNTIKRIILVVILSLSFASAYADDMFKIKSIVFNKTLYVITTECDNILYEIVSYIDNTIDISGCDKIKVGSSYKLSIIPIIGQYNEIGDIAFYRHHIIDYSEIGEPITITFKKDSNYKLYEVLNLSGIHILDINKKRQNEFIQSSK